MFNIPKTVLCTTINNGNSFVRQFVVARVIWNEKYSLSTRRIVVYNNTTDCIVVSTWDSYHNFVQLSAFHFISNRISFNFPIQFCVAHESIQNVWMVWSTPQTRLKKMFRLWQVVLKTLLYPFQLVLYSTKKAKYKTITKVFIYHLDFVIHKILRTKWSNITRMNLLGFKRNLLKFKITIIQ